MRVNYSIITLTAMCSFLQSTGQSKPIKISLTREFRQFCYISQLPQYGNNTITAQTSTYDITGGNDDGFDGTYSYLRKNADSSLVIFDVKGPGVINRFATPTAGEDTLDFYIDDDSKSTLSVKYKDLFSGKVYPFTSPLCGTKLGGYYCYFPILFQKSCKIVYRGKKLQFHQIQYKLFPEGTKVKSFSTNLNEDEKKLLSRIGSLWNKPIRAAKDFIANEKRQIVCTSTRINLKPGQGQSILSLNKGGRVLGIEFMHEALSSNIYIHIKWDNENMAAIDCPLQDFFGYAKGNPSMKSLLLGNDKDKDYCFYPMPFDRTATVEIYNKDSGTFTGDAVIYYSLQKRDKKSEGKFYAYWNKKELTKSDPHHVLLDTKGKGHYVSTILWTQGKPGNTWFFEGDDSTAIDGVPRIHGTGTEDYFNGGWYDVKERWDTAGSLPLYGCLGYSKRDGFTGGYRVFLNDKMSFEKSLYQCIEHGPSAKQGIPATYTSLVFYYKQ